MLSQEIRKWKAETLDIPTHACLAHQSPGHVWFDPQMYEELVKTQVFRTLDVQDFLLWAQFPS